MLAAVIVCVGVDARSAAWSHDSVIAKQAASAPTLTRAAQYLVDRFVVLPS
jgi:hypothetical protein